MRVEQANVLTVSIFQTQVTQISIILLYYQPLYVLHTKKSNCNGPSLVLI